MLRKTADWRQLAERAADVLKKNDLGGWTRPAPGLYPHQWLWDSCFIAIGLSHVNPRRAIKELETLMRGQWKNGMLPHIIFSEDKSYHAGKNFWRAGRTKQISGVHTTGITQPPMLAEAVFRVGKQLNRSWRRQFYRQFLPSIIKYHLWLYRERDPYDQGLVALIHPWESGMDNTPPWVEALWSHRFANGMRVAKQLGVHTLHERFRKDTKSVPATERTSTADLLLYYELVRRLRGLKYDSGKILKNGFAIYDLAFNAILARANDLLADIATEAGASLPAELLQASSKTHAALETLWSRRRQYYLSRNFSTLRLIDQLSVASLLPIYAGKLTPERVEKIVALLNDSQLFAADWPIPSVPLNSSYFKPLNYWQGPSWVNINWLIIDGLRRAGKTSLADRLKNRTLEMVDRAGFFEYFSPVNGRGAGSSPFSWTAALVIDMIRS